MSKFPCPQNLNPEFDRIIDCWSLSADLHEWNQGASDEEIQQTEQSLGRELPVELKTLYKISNGLSLFSGNFKFNPLLSNNNELSIANYSNQLREWEWPIPNELIIFGGNGSDDLYGIWLPIDSAPNDPHPIIVTGEVFEPECMAIAGTDLYKFLRGQTAFYALLEESSNECLDILGVPKKLRSNDPEMLDLLKWADPKLPDFDPDPYEGGLDVDQINEVIRSF